MMPINVSYISNDKIIPMKHYTRVNKVCCITGCAAFLEGFNPQFSPSNTTTLLLQKFF